MSEGKRGREGGREERRQEEEIKECDGGKQGRKDRDRGMDIEMRNERRTEK